MSRENFELKSYDHKHRWVSYWYQIREIFKLESASILEIGVGNKFLNDYLKKAGFSVTSLDINSERKPDVVGSVTKIPFPDNSFDLLVCCQVLEHLPYEDLPAALAELKRVSKKHVIISLPHWGWSFYGVFKAPLIKEISCLFKLTGFLKKEFDGEHYWEIGRRGYPFRKIKRDIEKAGLRIVKDYVKYDSPFHHFFVLEK